MRFLSRDPYDLTEKEWADLREWFRTSDTWNRTLVPPGVHDTGTGLHFVLHGFEVKVGGDDKHHWAMAFTPWSSRVREGADLLIEVPY